MTEPPVVTVTVRQFEVIKELCRFGASDQEIGRRLYITHNTVGTHLRKIYAAMRKAGSRVSSREELIVAVLRRHVVLRVVNSQERAK